MHVFLFTRADHWILELQMGGFYPKQQTNKQNKKKNNQNMTKL